MLFTNEQREEMSLLISEGVKEAMASLLKPADPPVDNDTSNEPQIIVSDPLVTAADEKLAQIIKDAPTGNIIVKGRRGAQMVNQSEESSNMIDDILRRKKHRYTRNNMF